MSSRGVPDESLPKGTWGGAPLPCCSDDAILELSSVRLTLEEQPCYCVIQKEGEQMSPSPSGSASSSGWSGPVVLYEKHLRGQARELIRSRNCSVYPLSGCGKLYSRRTPRRLSSKVTGSARIEDRGWRTTAASDTIRSASPRKPLTVACRSIRPSNIPAPRGSGPTRQGRAPALSKKPGKPDRKGTSRRENKPGRE